MFNTIIEIIDAIFEFITAIIIIIISGLTF